jgi:DNA-binding MarR family transcriptional regulator
MSGQFVSQSSYILERHLLDWYGSSVCSLSTTQRMVLLALARHVDKYAVVSWPGQARIASMAGSTVSTVQRTIRALEEVGLLKHVEIDGHNELVITTSLAEDRPIKIPIKDKPPKASRFQKPTVEEVAEYLNERSITSFDAQSFWDHYESKGWVVGKSPMKNWQAAVRTWERNHSQWGGDENYREAELKAVREEESGNG